MKSKTIKTKETKSLKGNSRISDVERLMQIRRRNKNKLSGESIQIASSHGISGKKIHSAIK